jgi:hypothetical protein
LTVERTSAARAEPVILSQFKTDEINLRRNVKANPDGDLANSENWQSLCRINVAAAPGDKLIHTNN